MENKYYAGLYGVKHLPLYEKTAADKGSAYILSATGSGLLLYGLFTAQGDSLFSGAFLFNLGTLAHECCQLRKENKELRKKVSVLEKKISEAAYSGAS